VLTSPSYLETVPRLPLAIVLTGLAVFVASATAATEVATLVALETIGAGTPEESVVVNTPDQ
jgi:hypothetical protein